MPTISELYFGAYNSQQIDANLQKIKKLLESVEIAYTSPQVSEYFGKIKAELKRKGTLISDFDVLIASYAMANDLILVTNNQTHFNRIHGIKVENWLM
jgi:tRNA(fMet)-specific endonuclease VapC